MTLNEYQHKRRFDVTSEPSGKARVKPGQRFVVQKHAATRLHYDFRLEFDGVLKSWAVPHGPSLDPTVKSLAVQVEDHPIDYADFEGTIPKGQYGGGTVMVWDRGTWETDDDIAEGLKRGKLSFRLYGEKLQGEWTLVRMRGRGEENWLLLKKKDEAAVSHKKSDILEAAPRSVLTGRDMSQIADNEKPIRKRKADKPVAKPLAQRADQQSGSAGDSSSKKTRKKSPAQASSNGSAKQQAKSIAAHLRKTPTAELPKSLSPQLATLADDVPTGDDWLHELKLDGYRVLARVERGKVRLITRSGLDWTERFSKIAGAVEELPLKNTILDGEVVALDQNGATDFQRLQNSMAEDNESSLIYYVFDVPFAEKHDLTDLPLIERKKILAQLILSHWPDNDGPVRYHDHIVGSGEKVLHQACQFAMEGIVSKKTNSKYVLRRSETWLKVKCVHNQEFVIAGYTKPAKSRIGFGALLLGYYQGDELVYCGRVGTGFTETSLRELTKRLKRLETHKCPYVSPPRRDQQRGVTWLRPELVAEISYGTRTGDGILRHAVFHGLREDKPARQVVLEKPALHPRSDRRSSGRNAHANNGHTKNGRATKPASDPAGSKAEAGLLKIAGVTISNPSRIVYPELRLTKGDVVQYLADVAAWMMPGIEGRPLTLVRCPSGPAKHCFYQKHLDDDQTPEGVEGVTVQEEKKEAVYPVIRDQAGLIALAQLNALEFHPWPARADDLEHPDFMVFDLDPGEGAKWSWVIEAARDVRDLLKKLGIESFVRTSGGKGLHVVAPFNRRSGDWDRLKEFSSLVAHTLAEKYPDRYVATIKKAARRGKVFVDYLRNQRGATSVASYSPRARTAAGVATPLRWRDLDRSPASDEYTVQNVLQRIKRLASDPWKNFWELDQDLPDPTLAERKPVKRSQKKKAKAK